MRGEQVERPGERHRGRLVPREDQRHGLVPDLPVVHPFAGLLVAGREEPAQEVVAAVSAGPAPFHEPVDDAVQTLHGPLPPAVVGRGDPGIERQERAQVGGGQVHHLQDLRHFPGVLLDVAPEERLADDVEGQLAHLPVDPDGSVESLGLPPRQQGRRQGVDRPIEAGQPAARERRLDESSLPDPVRPVVRDQAVPHHLAEHPVVGGVLGEVAVVLRQHRADEVRVVHDADVEETAPANEVPVLLDHLVHDGVRVPGSLPDPVKAWRRGQARLPPPDRWGHGRLLD